MPIKARYAHTNLVANDYAPVNIGQLKNVAYQTWVEMTNQTSEIFILK